MHSSQEHIDHTCKTKIYRDTVVITHIYTRVCFICFTFLSYWFPRHDPAIFRCPSHWGKMTQYAKQPLYLLINPTLCYDHNILGTQINTLLQCIWVNFWVDCVEINYQIEGGKRYGSKCYWIKNQVETSRFQPPKIMISILLSIERQRVECYSFHSCF